MTNFVRVAALAGALALALAPERADACNILQFELMPAGELQFAIWISDDLGNFVDTVRVTRLVGTFGIGNRAGRASTDPAGGFKSNYHWPYGKRLESLPIWAYGRGVFYPSLMMQDLQEDWLGFHESSSSDEPYYCKPQTLVESVDMTTCASEGFNSDKGEFESGEMVPYPPRNDLSMMYANDSSDMPTLSTMNDLDAVTMATPVAGNLVQIMFSGAALAPGNYIAWIEVNREGDANGDWWGGAHDCASGPPGAGPLPCFTDCLLPEFGECLHGQPSVVWQVGFTVNDSSDSFIATALDYAGYGSPTGADGLVNSPDGTITTGVDGSGAGRLLPMTEVTGDFRFKVSCNPGGCTDLTPPDPVAMAAQVPPDETTGDDFDRATIRIVHPADDDGGRVASYEIRYAEGVGSITDSPTFDNAIPGPSLLPADPGTESEVVLLPLRSATTFTVGIKVTDECLNQSELIIFEVVTEALEFTTVTPCGCAVGRRPGDVAGTGLAGLLVVGTVLALRWRRRSGRRG